MVDCTKKKLYNYGMEFKLKHLETKLNVTSVANLHFFEFEKDFFTKNDRHSFCELVYVSSGKLNIASEDFNGTLNKNQIIIHRASTAHSLSCTKENAPTVIIIGFECNYPKLDYFSFHPVTLGDSDVKKLAEIVKEGRNVFTPPYNKPTFDMKKKKKQLFGAEQMLKILLEYFLIELIRRYNSDGAENNFDSDSYSISINEIIKYVDDNYLEKITIDELAFLFKTNRATICREFKAATGKTIMTYIDGKKTAAAKYKIAHSDATFTQIAEDLNFESIHYFTRFFKKQTGMTPKEYRKTVKTSAKQNGA